MDVPVRNHDRPFGEVRADEGVGMIEPVSGEETGLLKRCFVAKFNRLQCQLSQLTVAPWLVGHHDFWEREFTQQLTENPCGFAFS